MTQDDNMRLDLQYRGSEKTCSLILFILSSYNVTSTADVHTAPSSGVAVPQCKQQGRHLEILTLRNK